QAASAACNLVVLPLGFLSGTFFPLDFAPSWMDTLSLASPLRHMNDGMLALLVRGEGTEALVVPCLALLLFTVVTAGLAGVFVTKGEKWASVGGQCRCQESARPRRHARGHLRYRPHRGARSCGRRAKEKEEPMRKTNALSELQGELELLESETFEVLDLVEAREEMLGSTTSTTSCCSSC